VAKLREGISVRKQSRQQFQFKKFHLRKIDEVQVKEKYQVVVSYRFADLEKLDYILDFNSAWQRIREDI
jgi:hypothetical protein